jgi:hypothetical protein
LKALIFLNCAGLTDRFVLREFEAGNDTETEIRSLLAPYFDKVTFPTVQFAPGEFINESDAIIEKYQPLSSVKAADMPALRFHVETVLPSISELHRENMELKKHIA